MLESYDGEREVFFRERDFFCVFRVGSLLRFPVLTDAAVDALGEQWPNEALTSRGGITDQFVTSVFSPSLDLFVVHRAISPLFYLFDA